MIARWLKRSRGTGSNRRIADIRDVLVDQNTDYLVDELGRGLEARWPTTTKALIDQRGLVFIDQNQNALIAL